MEDTLIYARSEQDSGSRITLPRIILVPLMMEHFDSNITFSTEPQEPLECGSLMTPSIAITRLLEWSLQRISPYWDNSMLPLEPRDYSGHVADLMRQR